ncbi:MAG: hypothetical protein V2I62_09065 [Bacteroidales bacterium]|jgi:hypothetical protein|nr:hypothetical protein [Bacteroidales bacterium]
MRRYIVFLLLIIIFVSCQKEQKKVVTQKIQYDVNIKSPDPDYDWWIQNLPGPQRENLVNMILDGALGGKFQAYDYFNNPISAFDVSKILSDTSVLTLMAKEPPYEYYDTTIVYTIQQEDILKIRFLETWSADPEKLLFEKKILGIAPIAKRIDPMGIERWQPLFWIYTDEEFIQSLKN